MVERLTALVSGERAVTSSASLGDRRASARGPEKAAAGSSSLAALRKAVARPGTAQPEPRPPVMFAPMRGRRSR